MYRESVRELVPLCLSGVSSTVMLYGAHKSGKTYALRGNDLDVEKGILIRTVKDLLKMLKKQSNHNIVPSNLYLNIYEISHEGI